MKKQFKAILALAVTLMIMFPAVSSAAVSTGWDVATLSRFNLPQGSITSIVINVLDWLLLMFGIFGIIGFLISGVMYILAAGDETTMERAKEAMKYSIIGVLVGLSGFVAIQAIQAILDSRSPVI